MEEPPEPGTQDKAAVAARDDGDALPCEDDVLGVQDVPGVSAEPLQHQSSRQEEYVEEEEEDEDDKEEDKEEGQQRPTPSPDLFAALQQAVSSLERAVFSRHGWPPAPSHTWVRAAKSLEELAGGRTAHRTPEDAVGLQEEAAAAAAGQAALRAALGRRDEELRRAGYALAMLRDERDRLQHRAQELQDALNSIEDPCGGSPGLGAPRMRRARSYHGVSSHREPPAAWPTEPEQRLQQLQGHLERLRAVNKLLSAALHDCKSHAERLSMVLGQHEAQGTALRMALRCSEHCGDAYAALLALTHAKMHPGASADEGTLRMRIGQLRAEQAAVQASLRAAPDPASALAQHGKDVRARTERALQDARGTLAARRPEPDNAELLQELATLKEAMADMRVQLQLVGTQKRGMEVLAAAQGPREAALRLLLLHLQRQRDGEAASSSSSSSEEVETKDADPSCTRPAAPTDLAGTAQELLETLARSEDLRGRTQALLRALERASTESRARHLHCSALAHELCHAHRTLALALRAARRRLEAQLRRRQAQAATLGAQQEQQEQALTQRLQHLEQLQAACSTIITTTTITTGNSESGI